MKATFFLSFLFVSYLSIAVEVNKTMPKTETGFIENKGQIHDQNNKPNNEVLYLLNTSGLNVQIKKTGFAYDTYVSERKVKQQEQSQKSDMPAVLKKQDSLSVTYKFHRIDIELVGANPNPQIVAEQPSSDYTNYYNVTYAEEGILNVHSFQKVTAKNIYAGIDVEYLIENGSFKYNFIVHPGADYKQINLKYEGAPLSLKNGVIAFELVQGMMEERIPKSWYETSGNQTERIIINYAQLEKNVFGFDGVAKSGDKILVIDPNVIRLWGTYYGGLGDETSTHSKCDASGNIFLCGSTSSSDNIATAGSHQSSYVATDAFIAKFNNAGVRQWATYYGGAGDELFQVHCATDYLNNVFLSGATNSTTNISTAGSHQTTFGGGSGYDVFLAKFNTSGVRQWGTYYGGSSGELYGVCATDGLGNVFLAGITASSSGISSTVSHQTSLGIAGTTDAFLAKFNTSGVRQWGTYYGGSGNEAYQVSCAADLSNNIFLSGITASTTNISTAGSHQPTFGGTRDAFLVKFNTSGVRQWGSYYGGTAAEDEKATVATDPNDGTIYLASITSSTANISTAGTHQASLAGGVDAFLAKFTTDGVRIWGTYCGGSANEVSSFCTVDVNSNVYLAGSTGSMTNISTVGAHQYSFGGGTNDAYVIKFTGGNGLRDWGTYYGGAGNEYQAISCATHGGSPTSVYVSGFTQSLTNISTSGSHKPIQGGSNDAFLARLIECSGTNIPVKPSTITTSQGQVVNGRQTFCMNSTAIFTVANVSGVTYQWQTPTGWTGATSTTNSVTRNVASLVTDTIRVIAILTASGCPSDTQKLHVRSFQTPAAPAFITGNTTFCVGKQNTFSVDSIAYATSYTWTIPSTWTFGSTPKTDSMIILPTPTTATGSLTVKARNFCGVSNATAMMVNTSISPPAQPSAISGLPALCGNMVETYSVTAITGVKYKWTIPAGWVKQLDDSSSSITVLTGNSSGTVSVVPYTLNNPTCEGTARTLTVTINTTPNKPGLISGDTTICVSATNTYSISSVSGATSYLWTLPSGWTGSSTTTALNATSNASTGNVTLKVKAVNGTCSSLDTTLSINVSPAIGTVSSITGLTTMCANSAQKYSITQPTNATKYTWTLPSGWAFVGNQDSIVINTTVGATTGNVSVIASNKGCVSPAKTLAITTVNVAPVLSGSISGSTAICQGVQTTYTVTAVSGATYAWTKNSGWSGTSTSNSIALTPNGISDTLRVTASNGSCNSAEKKVYINVSVPPSTPVAILGPSVSCQGTLEVYKIAKVTGASYYTWTYPSGWSGLTNTTDSFVSVTMGNTSGTLSVAAVGISGCASVPRVSASSITVGTTVPNTPGTIDGGTSYCVAVAKGFSVTPISGATGYIWTVPAGWTLNSGQNTTGINVTPDATAGTISVQAVQGGCKSGIRQSFINSVRTKPTTSTINLTSTSPCQGTSININCSSANDADEYTWTLPSGWTMSSPNGNTLLVAVVGNSGGNITVLPKNAGCDGTVSSQSVTTSTTPTISGTIAGETYVKSNVLRKYSISGVAGAQSYNWQVSPGWSIVGSNVADSVVVFTGNSTGILTVQVSNACGSSSESKQIFAGLASGINETSLFEGLQLYPVPARDIITVAFSLKKQSALTWRVINMLGQEMLSGETEMIRGGSPQELPVSISTLPVGMYQLGISDGNQTTFIKFSTIK